MPLHSPSALPSVIAPSRMQVDDDYSDQHSPSSFGIGGVRHHQPLPLHLSFPQTYSSHSSSSPYNSMQPQSCGSSTVPRGVSKARSEHGGHCGSEPSHASHHRTQVKLSYHQHSTVPTMSPSGPVRVPYERLGSLNGCAPLETGKVMDFEHCHLHAPTCSAAGGGTDISTCGSIPTFEDDPHDNLAGIVERAGGAVSSLSLSVPYLHLLCIRHKALSEELESYGMVLGEQALRFQELQHKERQLEELRKSMDQLTATNSAQANTLRNKIGDLKLEAKRLKDVTQHMEQDGRDFKERVEKERHRMSREFEEWKEQAFLEHEVAVMEAQEECERILMERDATHHAAMLQTTEEYNISLDEIRRKILRRDKLVTVCALTIQSIHRQLEDEKAVLHRSFEAEKHSLLVAFKSEEEALQNSFIAKTAAAKHEFLSQKQELVGDHTKEKLSMEETFQSERRSLGEKWEGERVSMTEAFAREKAESKHVIKTMQNNFGKERKAMQEGFAKEKAELEGAFAKEKRSIEVSFENERDELIESGEAAKGAWEEEKQRTSAEFNDERNRLENIQRHLKDDIEALQIEKRSLEDKNTTLQREKAGLEGIRGQLERKVDSLEAIKTELEDKNTTLQREKAGLEGVRDQLEKNVNNLEAIRSELEDKNNLIKGKEVQIEADRSRFDEVIKSLEAAREDMRKENSKMAEVLQGVAEEEEADEIRSRGDDFYIDGFTKLHEEIVGLSLEFSTLTKTPPKNLADVPLQLPSILGNSEASALLRQAYVQHVVSKYLCCRIFQPFLFSLGKRYDKADAFFQAMSSQLREKSTRKEAIWRHYTLLAGYTASDGKKNQQAAAATVIKEIADHVLPLADPCKVARIKSGVLRIVKYSVETWRYARMERELISARMLADESEAECWHGNDYQYQSLNTTDPILQQVRASAKGHNLLMPLLPVFSREGILPSLRRPLAERDDGLIFVGGVALYSDCLPVLHRLYELNQLPAPSRHQPLAKKGDGLERAALEHEESQNKTGAVLGAGQSNEDKPAANAAATKNEERGLRMEAADTEEPAHLTQAKNNAEDTKLLGEAAEMGRLADEAALDERLRMAGVEKEDTGVPAMDKELPSVQASQVDTQGQAYGQGSSLGESESPARELKQAMEENESAERERKDLESATKGESQATEDRRAVESVLGGVYLPERDEFRGDTGKVIDAKVEESEPSNRPAELDDTKAVTSPTQPVDEVIIEADTDRSLPSKPSKIPIPTLTMPVLSSKAKEEEKVK